MISKDDMQALGPEWRDLDVNRKDWREHLDKIVRLGDTGTRIVYWLGVTDVDPRGKRAEVFKVMRDYCERGRVRLYQRRIASGRYQYYAEVR